MQDKHFGFFLRKPEAKRETERGEGEGGKMDNEYEHKNALQVHKSVIPSLT